MAKKKHKPGKKKRDQALPPLPELRAMEGMLQQIAAGLQRRDYTETPLDKAQALMYRAFDEPNEKKRVRLAKDALAICPDCADAYSLLAEHTNNRKESRRLYEQGVAAGERALGAEAFERDVGHFWSILETRPYMRARLGLARALWSAGRQEQAVEHLWEMLRLNPIDNQGVRYTLASFLLLLDRDDDLARLLKAYDEDSASWAYTKALLAFRTEGDSPGAGQLLNKAKKANKHVPLYLTNEENASFRAPPFFSPGDETEALAYVGGFLGAWRSTRGAVAWLRASMAQKKAAAARPVGANSTSKKWLAKNLAQEFDVWLADCRQLPRWLSVADEMMRPWAILVTSRTREIILATELTKERPRAVDLWDVLVQAMKKPAAGTRHRPTELLAPSQESWEDLRPHLAEIGVALAITDSLDEIGAVFNDFAEHICGTPRPGLLDMPGITPAQVGRFYQAAAHFFQQAPWKKVGDHMTIKVQCNQYDSGPWYAVILGQSGLTIGLALYEDLQVLKRIWTGEYTDEERARRTVATSVTFGEEWSIPVPDLEAAKKYSWPVARSDAYPDIFHKEQGLSLRPPLVWQLELMEGCLRAVPEFVNRYRHEEVARMESAVAVSSGPLRLVLSWEEEA